MYLPEIYFVISFLYLAATVFLISGIRRKNPINHYLPSVSVIVAARNEEENIERCLTSLAKQDYYGEMEIIIVNDRSEDKTGEITENFIGEHPNFKLVNITETDEELTGKQYAMQTGIEQSTGDIIISTDADCEVSYGWVSSMASYFNDDIGLVAGYSAPPLGGVFSALQAMDHLFLVGIASGFSGTGLPQSCIGNNIAFRRSVYDDIGGYQGIGRTVTEDVGLLKGIANNTSYKVIFNREIESLVKTRPAFSLTELTSQRMRWLVGGFDAGSVVIISLVLTFLEIIFSAGTILLIPFVGVSGYAILALAIFFGSNLTVMLANKHLIDRDNIIKWFFPHQFFFMVNSLYYGILYLTGKRSVNWKGREYN